MNYKTGLKALLAAFALMLTVTAQAGYNPKWIDVKADKQVVRKGKHQTFRLIFTFQDESGQYQTISWTVGNKSGTTPAGNPEGTESEPIDITDEEIGWKDATAKLGTASTKKVKAIAVGDWVKQYDDQKNGTEVANTIPNPGPHALATSLYFRSYAYTFGFPWTSTYDSFTANAKGGTGIWKKSYKWMPEDSDPISATFKMRVKTRTQWNVDGDVNNFSIFGDPYAKTSARANLVIDTHPDSGDSKLVGVWEHEGRASDNDQISGGLSLEASFGKDGPSVGVGLSLGWTTGSDRWLSSGDHEEPFIQDLNPEDKLVYAETNLDCFSDTQETDNGFHAIAKSALEVTEFTLAEE